MDDLLIRQVAELISRYLVARPGAADTTRGVHDWWVDWPGPQAPLAVTEAALELLRASGKVSCSNGVWRQASEVRS